MPNEKKTTKPVSTTIVAAAGTTGAIALQFFDALAHSRVRFRSALPQDGGHATQLNFHVAKQCRGFVGGVGRRPGEQPLHLAHADAGGLQALPGVAVLGGVFHTMSGWGAKLP